MSAQNQIGYTNMPRTGTLPAIPPRRYSLRRSTVSQEPQSEIQLAASGDTTVWACYLPVRREVWKFPGHIGEHRRRIEELEGAWHARGDKILGLDCEDVRVTGELDDSDTIAVPSP